MFDLIYIRIKTLIQTHYQITETSFFIFLNFLVFDTIIAMGRPCKVLILNFVKYFNMNICHCPRVKNFDTDQR